MTLAPTIRTQRLTLRPYRVEDFEAYEAFVGSPRAQYMDGPLDRKTAWAWFCNDTASWAFYGFGCLMAEVDGRPVGAVGATQGIQFPEPEFGWFIFDAADEGKGYALEASIALRDWIYENSALETLVSCIDVNNAASIALATRLGAVHDPRAALPAGESAQTTHIYRHPSPAALQDGGMEAYA